jgi:NADPH-dependent F420 reductase
MMKVAILGGTGLMGSGLAVQLSKRNEVRIGSRSIEKARAVAAKIAGVEGESNESAARWCEAAVVAVPFDAIGSLRGLANALSGKLVISVINPIRREGGLLRYASEGPSAAELVAAALPRSSVATAFNNVPVAFFRKPYGQELDILVATDSKETYEKTATLVRSVPRLRPFYVGPLAQAGSVERLTVIILNAAILSGGSGFGVKLASEQT